ncbi:MAG: ABC transporter substrate-binding protein [Alphaproteobacteria bacterium]|nr:ABC transporter substrate-binding protein [Alphaproteobacteria bacterium]
MVKYLLKVLSVLVVFYLTTHIVHAEYAKGPQHGLEMYGSPKYPKGFTHFDYVNPKAPKGGQLTLSTVGTYDSLNPFVIKGTPAAGMRALYPSYFYATLMMHSYDEPFSSYGYVAETIEVAADGKSVRFVIRPEAVFHDGTPIMAEDVAFSFNIMQEKGSPYYKAYFHKVSSVEVAGPRVVKFNFVTGEDRELPLIIGDIPILSKTYYEKNDFSKSDLTVPLGSGPYQVANVDAGKSITYKRIKGWWAENLPVNKGRYNFDEIKIIYFRDRSVELEAFKSGIVSFRQEAIAKDWATGYDSSALDRGDFIKQHIKDKSPNGMTGLIFNIRKPLFQDIRVRKALTLVYDFEWANKNLFYGSYQRSLSYFSNSELAATGLPSAEEVGILSPYADQLPQEVLQEAFTLPVYSAPTEYREQLKKARQLLKEAGWDVQNGKLINKDGKVFEFQLLIYDGAIARAYNAYIKNLEVLGIKVNMRLVDTAQYQERVDDFDYDMVAGGFGQSITPGNEQKEFFGSHAADQKGSRNYIGVKNPAVDALIEKLIHAQTRQDLIHYVRALDRVLLWNFYMVPGYNLDGIRIAYWKDIKLPNILPSYVFDMDALWYESDK